MIPNKIYLHVGMTLAFLMTLIAGLGCEPKTPNNSDGNSPVAENDSAESAIASPEAPSTENEDPLDNDLSPINLESKVGQEVNLTGKFVVVDTYDLARRGQIRVARQRLYVPTTLIDPNDTDPSGNTFEGGSNVAAIAAAQKRNDTATITLDDGSSKQNIFPPKLFPELGSKYPTVRIGSVLNGIKGKIVKEKNRIFLVPSQPLDWTPSPRPSVPDVGDADIKIASFNVLNYFTTIDNGSNGARGADTPAELKRQEEKIVSAILKLDADIYGLMEMENNLEAESRLLNALNEQHGKDVFRGTGLPAGFEKSAGGKNAIRVGIIYRSDRVTPVGNVEMIDDQAFTEARTPLVQTFSSPETEKQFMVIVNHFKSKGGSDRADEANKNKGDGQGAYNATRLAQSLAICRYLDENKTAGRRPRALVLGDLNAYQQEDPIDAMRAKGMVDLKAKFATPSKATADEGQANYSFIYFGQSGSLDHVLATDAIADDVTGVATWHINADEPRFLDYNQEYNPKSLFQPDPYRSSDHDPVLIGIKN